MAGQRDSLGHELDFLEKLSIEELEALLRSSGDPDDVEALFDAVIEEVVRREKKEPTGRIPDVDAAWEEFQTVYNTPERAELFSDPAEDSDIFAYDSASVRTPEKKKRAFNRVFPRVAQIAAVVAITIALSFTLLIGVQAMGVDMFGALARWTNDTFHFETRPIPDSQQNDLHDSVQAMLDVQGMLGEYAPRWYPEGSKITKCLLQDDDYGLSLQISFSAHDKKQFYIHVDQYVDNNDIDSFLSERDDAFSEEYPSHGKMFYLFSNNGRSKGTWSDGKTVLSIRGDLTITELKQIIDSIGG